MKQHDYMDEYQMNGIDFIFLCHLFCNLFIHLVHIDAKAEINQLDCYLIFIRKSLQQKNIWLSRKKIENILFIWLKSVKV